MATTERVSLMRVVSGLAGFGLPGVPEEQIQIPDGSWTGVLAKLTSQRLTGLAVAALEAGRLRLDAAQAAELFARQRDTMLWSLAVERKLLSLMPVFDRAGVGVIVLKGPALAHTLYPDPAQRPFGDLDLLVRTGDWRRACDLLTGLGMRRRLPEPRPGFDVRFGKAAVHAGDDGVQVDLHRTLVLGPFGLWVTPDELFERTVAFRVGGRTLLRLDDTRQLLHVCIHASLGWRPPLMWPLRDVAQCAWYGNVDWGEVASLADRWRLRPVVRHAFRAAKDALEIGLPAPAEELALGEPTRSELRVLEAYTSGRRRRGGTSLSTLKAIHGIGAKTAYMRALIFPDRRFLRSRGRSSYLGRWSVPLRWLRRERA